MPSSVGGRFVPTGSIPIPSIVITGIAGLVLNSYVFESLDFNVIDERLHAGHSVRLVLTFISSL